MSVRSILIVEDDRFIGEMYKRSLEKAGYMVDWVINGIQGYQAACTGTYDLVVLDIILPELRGTEILKNMYKFYENKQMPRTIMLTNFDQQEEDRLVMEELSDAYYIKAEITPRKLVEAIGEL